MSVLRTILMAFLVCALLPWGALSARTPIAANPTAFNLTAQAEEIGAEAVGAKEVWAETLTAPAETMQKPLVKCRKALPGFPCQPEPVLLVSSPRIVLVPAAETHARLSFRLPPGRTPHPILQPPRSA